MPRMKLTKAHVDAIPFPEGGNRVVYSDTELKGFCLRVSSRNKIYYVVKRGDDGKQQWVQIGEHGLFTPERARKEAINELSKINQGLNINKEKKQAKARGKTLAEVFEEYLEARKAHLRPGTVTAYRSLYDNHLSPWARKRMEDISRDMVGSKHLEIGESSGMAQANKVMRLLRVLFNHLSAQTGIPINNPVYRLKDTRQWYKNVRRTSIIREADLGLWYEGVMTHENPALRDYLLLLMFSGLRRNEGLSLQWADVDMQEETFTVRGERTKNGKDHALPMTTVLKDVFSRREALRENEWVFPGAKPDAHLVGVQHQIENMAKKTGLTWALHDLRRTFASLAEQEVSYAVLKRLLNHSPGGDVTAGYVIIHTEDLRAPMQRITDRIMRAIQAGQSGKVIKFNR